MKFITYSLFLYLSTFHLFAQEDTTAQEIFVVVEQAPEYPGGEQEMIRFILSNIQYPNADVIGTTIEGYAVVEFIIDSKGKVVQPKIIRSLYPALDEEILRVVNLMPDWQAGKQGGQPVAVKMKVPIRFFPYDEEEEIPIGETLSIKRLISDQELQIALQLNTGFNNGGLKNYFATHYFVDLEVAWIWKNLYLAASSGFGFTKMKQELLFNGIWQEGRNTSIIKVNPMIGMTVPLGERFRIIPTCGYGLYLHVPMTTMDIDAQGLKFDDYAVNLQLILQRKGRLKRSTDERGRPVLMGGFQQLKFGYFPMNFRDDLNGNLIMLGVGIGFGSSRIK